jgi:AcrR family transcriptional regulator
MQDRYLAALRGAELPPAPADDDAGPLTSAQQETMDRLRHIALTVFEQRGPKAATADHISEQAGVSRRTFFRYFPTKEDALFCDHAAHLSRLDDLLAGDESDRLGGAVRAMRSLMDAGVAIVATKLPPAEIARLIQAAER